MRIIRIKNVIFDNKFFYDFAKLDLKHLLIINVRNTLEILKALNNIFFEMIIKKNNEINQMINHLKNELIKFRFVKSFKKTIFFYIDMKNIYFLIFEMTLNKD